MRDYRKYEVWKKAHFFATTIYKVSKSYPKSEQFGITSQIRRASLSIPTNLVEGCSRQLEKEFA
jgi:four helix bundle protein